MHTAKITFIGSTTKAQTLARQFDSLARAVHGRSPNQLSVDRASRGADVIIYCGSDLDPAGAHNVTRAATTKSLLTLRARGAHVFVLPPTHAAGARMLRVLPGKLHTFHRPRIISINVGNKRLAIAGFPHVPAIRSEFERALVASGWHDTRAHIKLLCLRALIEGVQYGRNDFTLRWGDDVLCTHQLPRDAAAIFGGPVDRAQVLERAPSGRRLAAPIVYLGSGRAEPGASDHVELTLAAGGRGGRALRLHLPAHPRSQFVRGDRAADSDAITWPVPTSRPYRSVSAPRSLTTTIEFPPAPLDLPGFSAPRTALRGPRH